MPICDADVRAAGDSEHWLQASNPSERWKWDFMFQDLPPVKFAGTPRATAGQNQDPLKKLDRPSSRSE